MTNKPIKPIKPIATLPNADLTAIAILRDSNTPVRIPADWWKKLSKYYAEYMRRVVLPRYGDNLSPRNRELLLNKELILKDGIIYRHNSAMIAYGLKPVKLTPEEINSELAWRAEYDRFEAIGEIPYWEGTGETREQYHARLAAEKINPPKRFKAPTKEEWAERARKEFGRRLWFWQLRNYMAKHETPQENLWRNNDEIRAYAKKYKISSYKERGIFFFTDRQVHRVMRYCLAGYIFYTYPITAYITACMAILYLSYYGASEYDKIKKRASEDFVADPKSRHSTALQYRHWLADRKRWKIDVKPVITDFEKKVNKDNKTK